METARLRRGVLPRLRTLRVYEFLAWLAIAASASELFDGFNGDHDFDAVLFGSMGVIVRIAIALAWVRCDETGVSWRPLFFVHRVPWDEVGSITIDMKGFLPRGLPRSRSARVSVPCLYLRSMDGARYDLGPSVWCSVTRQAEFIAAARMISPVDFDLFDESPPPGLQGHWNRAVTATRRSRSGKRVGQPIPRRREGPNA